jgi:hypothetical protein
MEKESLTLKAALQRIEELEQELSESRERERNTTILYQTLLQDLSHKDIGAHTAAELEKTIED